ncbi:MAG: ABC transporter ATP-binding protein/permease [Chloroflexota bacterium]|nr:ABC transporter ATP-binding protein/permease [Chloroflexota bacterium]
MRGSGIKYLWPYISGRRMWLIGCLVYAVIGASASAYSPYLLGRAVDELKGGVRLPVLAAYAAGLLALAATLATFRYLLRMLTGKMAAAVSYEMSRDMFARLLVLDQRNYAFFGTGDLLSRATSDFIPVWRFFSAGFQMMLHSFVLLVVGCFLMANASPLLAVLVFGCLVVTMVAQLFLGPVLERSSDQVQRDISDLSAFSQEHLTTVRMFKAYGQEAPVADAFSATNERYARSNLRFMLRSGLISPIPGAVVRLTAALVLAVGGALVIRGQLTIGQLVQFIVYITLLSNAAVQVSSAFERLLQGGAAAGRIAEVLRHEPHVKDVPGASDVPIQGAVAMRGVSARAGGRWALRNIDFEVPAGSTVGVVGATGAGKSTLLSLIARVQDPYEGEVLIDGQDIRRIKLDALRRSLAIVPQETFLFGMSLRDNITLGLDNVSDDEVEQAITTARLSNDLPQLPQGLNTPVGERGATLSGGQKQRTAIARALVRNPRILLLDDALASVDARTASQIIEGLASSGPNGRRRTTFIVTQHLPAVRSADHILVLESGTIAERGTHDELVALGGLYAAMHEREQEDRRREDLAARNIMEEPEPEEVGAA